MSNSSPPPEVMTARSLLQPLVRSPRRDLCGPCVDDLISVLGTHEVAPTYPLVQMWPSVDYRFAFDYCVGVVGFGEPPSEGVVLVPLLAILESKDLDGLYRLAQVDEVLDPEH